MSKTIDWTDSYNVCHWKLFPEEMVESTGYLECRDNGMFENTTFFGLQAWIKQKLIAEDPSKMDVDDAEVSWNLHGDPFNREGWEYIKDLGYYPLEIQAVPEGSWIPRGNVITQIRSTDPKCSWLPNWIETELTQLWYPIVIATSDKYNKFMLWKHLEETGCENIPAVLPYMLHDFGYRGCTCREQAMIGGAAHLLNFEGSDTIAGSHYIRKYYGERMIGCSIPATNHAVITSYGKANEAKAFKKVLDTYLKPGAIVACVSDSYDIYNAVDIWGTEFKDQIINSGGRLVIRPDCYDDKTEILTETGWKLFKDLQSNERVAQFDNGNISFTPFTNYVAEDYSGDMIKFSSEKYKRELVVTPNHRMVKLNRVIGKYEVKEASEIKYFFKHEMCVAGEKLGNRVALTPYEKLMIAYQADGRCKHLEKDRPLGGKYVLEFNFAKSRKVQKLLSILDEGGFVYKIKENCRKLDGLPKNWNQQTLINVYLDDRPCKHFNEWVDIQDISAEWCKEFLEEVSNWDATKRQNDRIKVNNTHKDDMEIVQTIATLAGYRATTSVRVDNRSEKFNDVYTVHITKKPYIGGQSISVEKVQYTGKIYCVTVPSGMLVVRRNGQPVISGNSGNPEYVLLACMTKLFKYFGYTETKTGHKLLPNYIRMIWGDGITGQRIDEILYYMGANNIAAENFAFGMGGGMLQKYNRDSISFAFKMNERRNADGTVNLVNKEPVTGKGKASKAGRQALIECDDHIFSIPENKLENRENLLRTVYLDGELLVDEPFSVIRERANAKGFSDYYGLV